MPVPDRDRVFGAEIRKSGSCCPGCCRPTGSLNSIPTRQTRPENRTDHCVTGRSCLDHSRFHCWRQRERTRAGQESECPWPCGRFQPGSAPSMLHRQLALAHDSRARLSPAHNRPDSAPRSIACSPARHIVALRAIENAPHSGQGQRRRASSRIAWRKRRTALASMPTNIAHGKINFSWCECTVSLHEFKPNIISRRQPGFDRLQTPRQSST